MIKKIIKNNTIKRIHDVLMKFERDRHKQNSNLAKFNKRKTLIQSLSINLQAENINSWNLLVKATQLPHLLKSQNFSPLNLQKLRRLEYAIFNPIKYTNLRFLYNQELLIEKKIPQNLLFSFKKNEKSENSLLFSEQKQIRVTRSNTKDRGLENLLSDSSEDSGSSEWDSKESKALLRIMKKVGYDWDLVSQCPELKNKTPLVLFNF